MMSSNPNIVTSNIEELPILSNGFVSQFLALNTDIEDRMLHLSKSISAIETKTCPIEENKYLWGAISNFDAKLSLCAVYDEFFGVSKSLMTEIQRGNDHTLRMLDLIKLLAMAEVDIYKHLENRSMDINEIKTFFKELCKENGIKDETIAALFNSTFERTYLLRDRINTLKNDMKHENEKVLKKMQHIEDTLSSISEGFDTKVNQAVNELNNLNKKHIEEYTVFVENKSNSLIQALDCYRNTASLLDEKIAQSFKESVDSITNMQNQLRSEIIKIQDNHTELTEKKTMDLEQKVKQLSKNRFFDSTFCKLSSIIISIIALASCLYIILNDIALQ